jgi:hypothetical protein
MYYPRPLWVPTARDAPAQQSVDQRPRAVSRPGVHHESCGLVHHEKVLVLKHYRNEDVLGFGFLFDGPGFTMFSTT